MKKILFAIILTSITMSSLAANVKVFNGRGLVGVFGNYTAKNKMVTYGNVGDSYFYVTLTNSFNGSYNLCYLLVSKTEAINITVSGLTCSLQTPNKINFGINDSSAANGTLLASVQRPMTINCSQFKDQVDAYIGISANVKPEFYSGNAFDVNLNNASNQAAAYVKLFVHHNGAKLPIRLDQTIVELGRINANENNVNITKTLEYELYSKGAGITGLARGSVELSVIMR